MNHRTTAMWIAASMVMVSLVVISCQSAHRSIVQRSNYFEIAVSSAEFFDVRQAAALRLNKDEAEQLRSVLLARIPGANDVIASNDIMVLITIGNEQTASALERKFDKPNDIAGPLGAGIMYAIETIRTRMKADKHFGQ